jgi:hypothetical protein
MVFVEVVLFSKALLDLFYLKPVGCFLLFPLVTLVLNLGDHRPKLLLHGHLKAFYRLLLLEELVSHSHYIISTKYRPCH